MKSQRIFAMVYNTLEKMEVGVRLKDEIGRKNTGAKINMPDFSLFFNGTPK